MRRRICQRNRVPDDDVVCTHQDFFDQQSNDFSTCDYVQSIRIALQTSAEFGDRVQHAQAA